MPVNVLSVLCDSANHDRTHHRVAWRTFGL